MKLIIGGSELKALEKIIMNTDLDNGDRLILSEGQISLEDLNGNITVIAKRLLSSEKEEWIMEE